MTENQISIHIYYLLHYFFIFSFLGWAMETCLNSFRTRSYINRGFLNGPICPVYGVGMCLIIILLSSLKESFVLLFIGGFVLATGIEYFVGYILEKLFNAKWWDYSHKPFNLHGRICLKISLCWGILSVVMMGTVVPAIDLMVSKVNILWGWVYLSLFMAITVIDTAVTIYSMYGLNRILNELTKIKNEIKFQFESAEESIKSTAEGYKTRLPELPDLEFESYKSIIEKWKNRLDSFTEDILKDNKIKEITQNISELKNKYTEQILRPNKIHKRLLKAYPNLKARKNNYSLQEIRMELKKRIKSKISRED